MAFNRYSLDLESGSSQFASITNASQTGLNMGSGNFTIEAWIRLESLGATQGIIMKGAGGTSQKRYVLRVDSSNHPHIEIDDDTTLKSVTGASTLVASKWYHVAGVRDGNNLRLYLNGVSDQTATDITGYGNIDDTEPFTLGAEQGSGGTGDSNRFDGLIDNVMVYSDARSQAEIQADMFTQAPSDANLEGHWDLEGDYVDSSGNGNTLTASGSPVFSTNVPWTGANETDWTVSAGIKADNTKVSGASDLTNFPVLIKDGNIPDSVYAGLKTAELNNGQISTTGLVGYWRLESSSADSIGSNTGTDTNMAYGSSYGKFGNGALFNSTPNSFITKASPTGLPSGNTDLSINVWANPRVAQSAGVPALITWGAESNYAMAGFGLNNTGFYWLGYSNDASQAYSYATGSWTMFTATYVASSKTVKFYANGVQIGAGTVLTNTPNVGTTFLNFSKQRPGNAVYFDGQMDDASIWSRTLSAEEVLKLYQGVGDFRITTDSAGTTEIPYEIVSMDTTAKTAEVWAKIPTLTTATDTSIYLWSGNASAIAYDANAPFGSQAVWSGFSYVEHLQGQSLDSTANAINPTDANITYSTANGFLSQGGGFNGSTSRIYTGDVLSLTGNFTISTWLNPTAVAETVNIIQKGQSGARYPQYSIQLNTSYKVIIVACGDVSDNNPSATVTSTTALTLSAWERVTFVRDGTNIIVYKGASSDGSTAWSTAQGASTDHVELGSVDNSGTLYQKYNGKMDDIRVTTTALSSDWIATEYANQNAPSTFWSAVSSGGYTLALMGVGR